MDLLGIRQNFCRISGRYDLATTNVEDFDTDNGADFYITSGQDFLDRLRFHKKTPARIFEEVAAGSWYFTFQHRCRAITEVWVNNDEERFELGKVSLNDLRSYYTGLRSDTDQGEPQYFAPALLRSVDSADIDSLGEFFNYVLDDSDDYTGIIFMPPSDEAYVVEVVGHFYSNTLSDNADDSFWTLMHPMILVWAACYMLEVSHRNTEGAKDWLNAITLNVEGIDKDTVEEEISNLEEMEG